MSDAVLTAVHDSTLVVTLNRPRSRNAIDPELAHGVRTALERLDAASELRVGVVVGADSTFCSGMDLRAFGKLPPSASAEVLGLLVDRQARKPIVAAIEGSALGGGLELALSCDLIVAATDARLGLPEVRWSLVPSGGGLVRLPRRLPVGVAMDMALTGEPQSGERLHDLGLVARTAPPGEALEVALGLAKTIGANGPAAVQASRALVREAAGPAVDDPIRERQAEVAAAVNGSADAREGIAAFLERRAPRYRAG